MFIAQVQMSARAEGEMYFLLEGGIVGLSFSFFVLFWKLGVASMDVP